MSKYIKASGMLEVIEMLRWSNYLDKNSTLNLLVRAIEQSPTDTVDAIEVPTWIPVTERLPEPYKDVLVVEYNGWDQKVEVNSMLSNGWLYDGRTVTHWMPLPQPPKDGE